MAHTNRSRLSIFRAAYRAGVSFFEACKQAGIKPGSFWKRVKGEERKLIKTQQKERAAQFEKPATPKKQQPKNKQGTLFTNSSWSSQNGW